MFESFVSAVRDTEIKFPQLRAAMLAQAIMESGRETTDLAKVHHNHHGMKYRQEMDTYAIPVMYQTDSEPTGSAYFCKFEDKKKSVTGYWHFLTRSPYNGWESHTATGVEFLQFVCPIWCPAGYTPEWIKMHSGLNYHEYVIAKLLPECEALIAKRPVVGDATWFEIFRKGDTSTAVICANDGALCVDKEETTSVKELVAFLQKHPKAGSFLVAPAIKAIPDVTSGPIIPIPTEKTEWIPFATKIDKMARRKEVWPVYFIIHWTAGEPSQKGSDGIASGVSNGYTYCFLERSGKLFQGAPTNQGGYHAGNANVSSLDCLGVEVACAGKVEKIGDLFVPWFAKNSDGSVNKARCIAPSEIIYDKDDTADDGSFAGYYQSFTPEQKATLLKMALYCVQVLGMPVANIRGHDEVATPHGRKVDPGFSIGDGGMVQFRADVSKLNAQGKSWIDL